MPLLSHQYDGRPFSRILTVLLFDFLALTCLLGLSTNAQDASATAEATGTFELLVVGPDNKPIPNAEVEVRGSPNLQWNAQVGSLLRKGTYGPFMQTDSAGRLLLKLPEKKLRVISFSIRAAGFGPFWANWSMSDRSEKLPASYTAKLDAAQSVGSMVVDEKGNPVVGAQVHPSIEYKKRESDQSQLGSGKSYKTNERGRWRDNTIPADYPQLRLTITHPDFMPQSFTIDTREYGLQLNEAPHKSIALSRGLTLQGVVTDEQGDPIEDAIVRLVASNETLEVKTDSQGHYQRSGFPTGTFTMAVTAKGYAPELRSVDLNLTTDSVNFALKPAKTIRVRVVDRNDKPVPKTRIFFQRWRGEYPMHLLGMVHEYTDEKGLWIWDSAPHDSFICDICPPNGMQIVSQELNTAEPELTFVATPTLAVHAKVLDAEGKKPIAKFRVIPGMRWRNQQDPFWNEHESFDGIDGAFDYRTSRVDGTQLLRVEALGYKQAMARDIEWNEGAIDIEFLLEKAVENIVKITSPKGELAVGVDVAIMAPGSQVMIENGKFTTQTYAPRVRSNAEGEIRFPAQATIHRLVMLHESGYAEINLLPNDYLESIELTPWASVSGTLKSGDTLAANVSLQTYSEPLSRHGALRDVRYHHSTNTDDQGNFSFERLVGKHVRVGRAVLTHINGNGHRISFSHGNAINLVPGQTVHVVLGGSGNTVIGKLMPPDDLPDLVNWKFATVSLEPQFADDMIAPAPNIPAELKTDEEKAKWRQAWSASPEGIAWNAAQMAAFQQRLERSNYVSAVDESGNFRLDDIPPGEYKFSVSLEDPNGDRLGFDARPLGKLEFKFEIPRTSTVEIYDMGEQTLRRL